MGAPFGGLASCIWLPVLAAATVLLLIIPLLLVWAFSALHLASFHCRLQLEFLSHNALGLCGHAVYCIWLPILVAAAVLPARGHQLPARSLV